MVKNGLLVHIDPEFHTNLPNIFLKEAGKHIYYLHFPLSSLPQDAHATSVEERKGQIGRLSGLYSTVHRNIVNALGEDCGEGRMIEIGMDDGIQDMIEKLGQGAPIEEPHKGFVFSFVGIPGLGKSAIVEGIQFSERPDLHLKVVCR